MAAPTQLDAVVRKRSVARIAYLSQRRKSVASNVKRENCRRSKIPNSQTLLGENKLYWDIIRNNAHTTDS